MTMFSSAKARKNSVKSTGMRARMTCRPSERTHLEKEGEGDQRLLAATRRRTFETHLTLVLRPVFSRASNFANEMTWRTRSGRSSGIPRGAMRSKRRAATAPTLSFRLKERVREV